LFTLVIIVIIFVHNFEFCLLVWVLFSLIFTARFIFYFVHFIFLKLFVCLINNLTK